MVSPAFPHISVSSRPDERSGRLAAVGVTLALHAAAIALLLQFQPVRSALTQAVPIMVSLITRPPPVKPRAQRVEPKPEPPPLIAAATETPPPPTAPAPQPITASPPAPVAA